MQSNETEHAHLLSYMVIIQVFSFCYKIFCWAFVEVFFRKKKRKKRNSWENGVRWETFSSAPFLISLFFSECNSSNWKMWISTSLLLAAEHGTQKCINYIKIVWFFYLKGFLLPNRVFFSVIFNLCNIKKKKIIW